MTPLTKLMGQYISRAGQAWHLKQKSQTAAHLRSGQGAAGSSTLKEYVQLTSETEFMIELVQLSLSPEWRHLPVSAWSLRFEAQCFRMLSRMGCTVHQLLMEPCKACPFRLLRLVTEGPQAAEELAQLQPCCLDSFSQAHLEAFPGEALLSPASLATLSAVLELVPTEIVGMEWGHGRVHRLICKSSVQTHVPTLDFVGAQWLCQKVHQRAGSVCEGAAQRAKSHRPSQKAAAPAAPPVQAAPKKRRRGGGGAWRAFVSKRTRGAPGSASFDLGQEYRDAKEQQSPEYLAA